jgi:isochorismate hydrolase
VRIWGEHAIAGTPGANVIPQLQPGEGEIVSPEGVYGGFEGTRLDEQLKARGAAEFVITVEPGGYVGDGPFADIDGRHHRPHGVWSR